MLVENLKNQAIDISSSGDNTIIVAPPRGYIAIDHLNLVPNSAVGLTLKSGSTELSGTYSLTANQGFTLDNPMQHQKGVITCADGEALVINLDSVVQCSGFVRYRIVGE